MPSSHPLPSPPSPSLPSTLVSSPLLPSNPLHFTPLHSPPLPSRTADRRQTSWLFRSTTKKLNWGLPRNNSILVVRVGLELPTSGFQLQCANHSVILKPFMLSWQLVINHWEWRTALLQTAKSQLPALKLIEIRVSNQPTAD